MKTNWRRLGEVLAGMTSSREKLRAAANDGAQPDEEMAPGRLEGGGTAGRAPTQVDHPLHVEKGSRSADQWTVRPPRNGRGPKAPAASDRHVKEPSPSPEARPVLPASVDGKRGPAHDAPKGRSPSAGAGPRLLSGEDHSPSSHSISDERPSWIARQSRMQIAIATTHHAASKKRQKAVVALMP